MNIVLYGDSHLARFGKEAILLLEEHIPGSTVFNCSAGGFTSEDGARRADYIASLRPDLVVFSYGGNDVAPWKQRVSKPDYLQNMTKIFKAFAGAKKIIFFSPDAVVADVAQRKQYNDSLHDYRSELVPLCASHDISILRANQVLSPLGDTIHVEDGIHMNEAAYRLFIKALADSMKT